jgi:probable nitrogen fixation protein
MMANPFANRAGVLHGCWPGRRCMAAGQGPIPGETMHPCPRSPSNPHDPIPSKEQKRAIPTIGDPDEVTLARVKAFHNAIAVLIEKECGQMAVPFVQITHEGFGRALITVGKLVVMDRTLRDVHRFGFDSLSKMKTEADKHLAVALEIIGKYPDVAGM